MTVASRCAFAGAALFVALIVAFSSLHGKPPSPPLLVLIGCVAAAGHLVLFPVVAALPAPSWARAAGYAWLAFDSILNVATINGADPILVAALRLGGHPLAALWIASASAQAAGPVQPVGLALGLLLAVHAVSSPWIPMWVIFVPFMMIPLWLVLVGRLLSSAKI